MDATVEIEAPDESKQDETDLGDLDDLYDNISFGPDYPPNPPRGTSPSNSEPEESNESIDFGIRMAEIYLE